MAVEGILGIVFDLVFVFCFAFCCHGVPFFFVVVPSSLRWSRVIFS